MTTENQRNRTDREALEVVHKADVFMNRAFARLEAELASRKLGFLGYEGHDIASRIVQLVELGYYDSFLARTEEAKESDVPCLRIGRTKAGSYAWFADRLNFGVSPIQIFLRLMETFGVLAFFGFAIARAAMKSKGSNAPVSIFLSSGIEAFLDSKSLPEEFEDYCQRGPLTVLRGSPVLLVHTFKSYPSRDRLHFSASPWKSLPDHTSWTWSEWFSYLGMAARTFLTCVVGFSRHPELSLLSRDFGFHAFITLLVRSRKLDNVITTASTALSQEIWLNHFPGRNFGFHMIWYATNTRRFPFKESRFYGEYPPIAYIEADVAWTCSRGR